MCVCVCVCMYIYTYIIIFQPTPKFLPGKFHGQRNLACCCPWGSRELDMTEPTHIYTLSNLMFNNKCRIFCLSCR